MWCDGKKPPAPGMGAEVLQIFHYKVYDSTITLFLSQGLYYLKPKTIFPAYNQAIDKLNAH